MRRKIGKIEKLEKQKSPHCQLVVRWDQDIAG
jgi:hypothetical protein